MEAAASWMGHLALTVLAGGFVLIVAACCVALVVSIVRDAFKP